MTQTNPFVTLEALHEHIGSTFVAGGVHELNSQSTPITYPVGSVPYHLAAIRKYGQQLFQMLVNLLPVQYATYTHEEEEVDGPLPTLTLIDVDGFAARLKPTDVAALAAVDREWQQVSAYYAAKRTAIQQAAIARCRQEGANDGRG
jgi:hypothetical protein